MSYARQSPQAGEAEETVCPTFESTALISVAQSGKPQTRTVSLRSGELLAAGRFANRPDPEGTHWQPVGMALRATKGDENPRGLGDFDEARKGWPGGQPRTRGSALLRQVSPAGLAISRSRLPFAAILAALALAPLGCNRDHKVTVKETVEEAPGKAAVPVVVSMGDPKQQKQLVSGFYGIEANAWRWTGKDFTVSLRPPAGSATQGATLDFALSVPQVTIDKLKSITLSASINGTALAPETYAHEGQYDYKRDIPSNLIQGDAERVEFHLDKSMPPAGGDARELGVVARSVGLASK
jgi:hypothetical protein